MICESCNKRRHIQSFRLIGGVRAPVCCFCVRKTVRRANALAREARKLRRAQELIAKRIAKEAGIARREANRIAKEERLAIEREEREAARKEARNNLRKSNNPSGRPKGVAMPGFTHIRGSGEPPKFQPRWWEGRP